MANKMYRKKKNGNVMMRVLNHTKEEERKLRITEAKEGQGNDLTNRDSFSSPSRQNQKK